MANVNPDQDWGISKGIPDNATIQLKNGWLDSDDDDGWIVNSIGHIQTKDSNYTVIVDSDNDATTTLLNTYQDGYTGPDDLFSALHMTQSKMNPDAWGMTTTTAQDQLKLLNALAYGQKSLHHQDSDVNIGVYNALTKQTTIYNSNTSATYPTASIVKVSVLANLLRMSQSDDASLSPAEKTLAESTKSMNHAKKKRFPLVLVPLLLVFSLLIIHRLLEKNALTTADSQVVALSEKLQHQPDTALKQQWQTIVTKFLIILLGLKTMVR
ncbi:hypothetical protein GQS40_12615|uniref:Serine hydrolase n=1 Tax=Leuconostoc lactis TaxID=1246 RepID=A0A6L7A8U6_LEULA|nr:hypothetical protein [Leuconostoc lactis]